MKELLKEIKKPMARTSTSKITLRQKVQDLEQERQQTQRALDALYRVGLACRGITDSKALLHTIYKEMMHIWRFDAFYIALCDEDDVESYRLALLVDEDEEEFIEHVEIGTLTRYLIEQHTPLLFANLVEERERFGLPPATQFGSDKLSRSWMGVPLMIGQNAIGVVSIQSYQTGEYTEADLDLLNRIASSMAVALENATLSHRQIELSRSLAEQVALRNADLFVISDIAAILTQQQQLPTMLGMALDFLIDALHSQFGVISEYLGQEHRAVVTRGRGIKDLPLTIDGPISALGKAIRHRKIATEDFNSKQLKQLEGVDLPHILVAPLLRSDTVIGTLIIAKDGEHSFKDSEIELIHVVSNQLALALEQSLLLQQRDRQIAELEAMRRIAYSAGRSMDTAPLLREIHDALQTVVTIDVFYMAIYDIERDVITQSMAVENGKIEQYQEHEMPPTQGSFSEWVLRQREGLFLEDVSTQLEQYPGLVRYTIGSPAESWMGVPLFDLMQQPIGLISIQSYTPYAFSTRDRQFLQAVASQVGLHVRNVQLFRQRERQLAELNAIQRISELTSSTLDLHSMISSIDEVMKSFLGVDGFFVVLVNPQEKTIEDLFILEGGQNIQAYEYVGKRVPAKTPTSWILEHGKSLRFNDILTETAEHDEIEPSKITETTPAAWMGVPILNRDGIVMGALVIQSYRANQFSLNDEQFMLQVGRQLSMSIQNARLFAERERQLKELDALQRISELVSSTLELQPMIRSIDEILRLFLQADAFQVVMVDPDTSIVEVATVIEQGQDIGSRLVGKLLPQETFVAWTLRNSQPLRIGNIMTEWQDFPGLTQPTQADGRPKPSWLSVPMLQSDGKSLGVLAVRAYRTHAFNEQDERFLMSVAHQLSMSMRNARLYQAEQKAHRTAETLREIARVLNTTFNPDEVLALILRELKQVIDYDSASVMLPVGKKLRIVARQSEIDDGDNWRQLQFEITPENGAGRVMLNQEPLIIHDTVQETDWVNSPMPYVVRSWIGVPLISKGNVLGVLNINALLPHSFQNSSVDIAMTFANQAATALEHARLYQESVTRVEQELEIAHEIQSNLFPKELPKIPRLRLAGMCIPARETGGDFFEIITLSEDMWGFIVGDVSGKSIPAAMLMAVARSIVRSEAWDHQHPEVVMAEANHWIGVDIPRSSFVALLYATYTASTGSLSLSNAGQLEPIRIGADGSLEYLTVPDPRLPLGIQTDILYKTATYQLKIGDRVVMYTDGIIEAKNRGGELWGFERFEETLQALPKQASPQDCIAFILNAMNTFTEDHIQHDDITLIVISMTT